MMRRLLKESNLEKSLIYNDYDNSSFKDLRESAKVKMILLIVDLLIVSKSNALASTIPYYGNHLHLVNGMNSSH